ncbi:MAG: bifunctional hydroxymethylpyrimidine kinase/phosphomethylpyrimidine kinase [Hyphomicrobiaceae bacterium]
MSKQFAWLHFGNLERMSRFLAISSQVACGHVGLSAIVPAIQAMGHEVIALPTVILSNHPGHAHVAGERIADGLLQSMVDALSANGWLSGLDVMLTGYLPSADHVAFAAATIAKVKAASPQVSFLCDPILGDEAEGLYLDAQAADEIRDKLLPLADIALPNRFELGWLTDRSIDSVEDAVGAAAVLPCSAALVTSVPCANDQIANLLTNASGTEICPHPQMRDVPKGTGDFLSGVFAADPDLARTTGRVTALVEASVGRDHIAIAEARDSWLHAPPADITKL